MLNKFGDLSVKPLADITVIPAPTLNALYDHLMGTVCLAPAEPPEHDPEEVLVQTDFSEIKGQEHVKRALEVAAEGGYNLDATLSRT